MGWLGAKQGKTGLFYRILNAQAEIGLAVDHQLFSGKQHAGICNAWNSGNGILNFFGAAWTVHARDLPAVALTTGEGGGNWPVALLVGIPMIVSAATAGAMIVAMGVLAVVSGILFFTAATVLSFAVAMIATAAAFGVVMFLMIMVFMVMHNVPLRAVNELLETHSTPWSPLQSQAPDENYC
ncbi:hypothetical protein SLIQ_21160 [Serratia liquefaciens FK01]|nr:hypothetical protein SLIQ_21160 [Serratia liquefaciens FK01]